MLEGKAHTQIRRQTTSSDDLGSANFVLGRNGLATHGTKRTEKGKNGSPPSAQQPRDQISKPTRGVRAQEEAISIVAELAETVEIGQLKPLAE